MFSAAPVLFVLSIMLSLNIIGAKPIRPWWSWENSVFIYIYLILFILLMVMYLSVLSITIPKLNFIKQKLQRNTPASMRKRYDLGRFWFNNERKKLLLYFIFLEKTTVYLSIIINHKLLILIPTSTISSTLDPFLPYSRPSPPSLFSASIFTYTTI